MACEVVVLVAGRENVGQDSDADLYKPADREPSETSDTNRTTR